MPARHRLEYSRPYFRGEFRYRHVNLILLTIIFGAMSATFGYVATLPAERLFHIAFFAGCIFMGAVFAWFLYGIVTNLRHKFVIAPDGILASGKLTPWSAVARFSAYGHPAEQTVTLFFQTSRLGPPHHLMTHPGISPTEYETLVSVLRSEVAPLYPDLEIGGYESESS